MLAVSENTGVTDVAFDPRNPNVLYATAYQRRRHVWTLIDGGPESGIYRSMDGSQSWRKINKGLPDRDKGRIGLAVSPVNPDVVYATVEAARGQSGFYRSENTEARAGPSDPPTSPPARRTTRSWSPTPTSSTASTRWTR